MSAKFENPNVKFGLSLITYNLSLIKYLVRGKIINDKQNN
ncbi:conserved protein of unknown function [Clostridium beijerinckii]|nr:conserved protein of unknown function [Clostridium beijerinckii]